MNKAEKFYTRARRPMRKPIIIAVLSLSGLISSLAGAEEINLQDDPPQQYVVVKGDTLWGISARFLKDPWRWPDLWRMNRDQIKNPHWIYPGDLVVLDMNGGSPLLRLVKGGQTDKVSPRIRTEAVESEAVPAIPPSAIGPFLSRPLVIEEDALDHSPYIVGHEDERVIMGRGDKIFVAGAKDSAVKDWSIFRKGKLLLDPETNKPLGYEAEYIGEAKTLQSDDVMTAEITSSAKEVHREDRLVPTAENRTLQYIPHAPQQPVKGRIISAYGAASKEGLHATVVVNKGRNDGIEEGHVLAVYRKGRNIEPLPGAQTKNSWRYADKDCLKPGKTVSFDQFYDPKEVFQPCTKDDDTPTPANKSWLYSDIGCLMAGVKVSFDQFFNPKDVYKPHCRGEVRDTITLPDTRTGLIFVYRVFDHVSYALVMSANRPVYLLDVVKNP